MNQLVNSKIKSEIHTLISIVKSWLDVLEEIEILEKEIKSLPLYLVSLQQELTNIDSVVTENYYPEIENEIQDLVNKLSCTLPQLINLDKKTKNLISLKEVIEALQDKNTISSVSDYNYEFSQLDKQSKNFSSLPKTKLNLLHKLQILKRQYPENFWSAIIAIVFFVIVCWRATDPPLINPVSSSEPLQTININR